MSVATDKDVKGPNAIRCMSCTGAVRDGILHTGIKCLQNHHICVGECCANFVDVVLGDPNNQVPLKCPQCKAGLNTQSFEMQLTPEQNNCYLSYVAMKQIGEDEKVTGCPSCSYFEIRSKECNGMDFMFCQNTPCRRTTCVHCFGTCKKVNFGGYNEEDEERVQRDNTSFLYHLECGELAKDKIAFETAIVNGSVRECPACGVAGIKDDNCTHITCQACDAKFCYVCGLSEEAANKSTSQGRTGTIYAHNVNWKTNPRRCPMYLHQICEVDPRWPSLNDEDDDDDDEEDDGEEREHGDAACVNVFVRIRTLTLLRAAVNAMGMDRFKRLRTKYASVNNCGFSTHDIMNADLAMIRRTTL